MGMRNQKCGRDHRNHIRNHNEIRHYWDRNDNKGVQLTAALMDLKKPTISICYRRIAVMPLLEV